MGMYQRPTIIWLDGGPGQSSMLGNLLGVGPLVWDEDELKLNEFSWNRENNLLVVDQPVDTGYSYASTTDDIPKDLNSVAVSFYEAMDEFFTYKVFTPLKKQHWFMVGSDYAGKYIPYIVKHFHE
jgi:carboxypeptidase C (cathepsin A)